MPAKPSPTKLLTLLSGFLPALGLPAVPLDEEMITELQSLLGRDKDKDSTIQESWALVSQIGLLKKTGDKEYREIVETILSDPRFDKLSRELLSAMIRVGSEKALANAH